MPRDDGAASDTKRIIRVFPRRTKATPDDELAYVGGPSMSDRPR